MSELQEAIERGDLGAFVAQCRRAVENGDIETLEIALATLARMPAGVVDPLKRRVRETFPELVAGLPSFLVGETGEPMRPSTPLNALLARAIDGDRDGALRAIAEGGLPAMPGGRELAEAIVRAVPSRAGSPRPLIVDRGENLIVSAPGERGTFVVFTGLGERVWLDLPVFDAWLAHAGYRGVYLRDPSRRLFTEGTPDHPGADAFAAFLGAWRAQEPGELVYLGTSSGGFGAMYWACAVPPDRTLAFASATSTTRARLEAIGDQRALMLQRLLLPAGGGPDLRERMQRTGFTGRVDLHYGAQAGFDRAHAEYLDLPNVNRIPLPGWSHHQILQPLAASGRLPAILGGGDLDAFLAHGEAALARGDVDSVRAVTTMLARLPPGPGDALLGRVRARFPELVDAVPALARPGVAELRPSRPVDALLMRAIDGDRDGALAALPAVAPAGDRWHGISEGMLRRVPTRASLPRPLLVDRGEEVTATAPGARGTMVVFTGMGDRVWMDLPVFDAWLAAAGYGGVYLRDRTRRMYTRGLSDAIDAPALAARLARIRDEAAGEVVFLGASVGGFGAIRWAAELGIGRTVAFAPQTSLDPARLREIGEKRLPLFRDSVVPGAGGVDLRRHIAETGHAGRIDLYYGAIARLDRSHAEYLQGPAIRHHALDGWGHHRMLPPLAAAGRLPAILRGED